MALPITHRWITVGNVILRNSKRSSPNAPTTSLDEVIQIAVSRLTDGNQLRHYGKDDSRLMWFTSIQEQKEFYWFLAETGDQNVTDFSYLNFKTLKSRDVKKRDNEGGHYTAHVAISKKPLSKTNGHLILIEKVPGVYLGSLKDHFTWLANDKSLQKLYVDEKGQERFAPPVFVFEGYESGTIRDALHGGILQDIEFVQMVERYEDGLDEESVVRQSVHEARWVVKQRVNEEQANSVFSRARSYLPTFNKSTSDHAKVFVRIKTPEGQIRQTEIDAEKENILEQAFVRNEIVNDFDTPLTQRHDGLRTDMVEKMKKIADDLLRKDGLDA